MSDLPRCPKSDLPRVLCACCDGFPLAPTETEYLQNVKRWGEPPSLQPPPGDTRCGQPIPEYQSTPVTPPARIHAGGGGAGNPCQACGTPAGDAYLCPGCTDQTERDLAEVPALLTELGIHATGQSRFAGGSSGNGLPYAERAAQLIHDIRNHLTASIRTLTETRGLPTPALGSDTTAMAHWLLTRSATIPLDPAGPDIATGLRHWHQATMRAIDAPPPRTYIGLCDCGTAMHAPNDTPEYRCNTCGRNHNVQARLADIDTRIRDIIATVGELTTLAQSSYRGRRPITRRTITHLIERGRLQPVGKTSPARYRAGDLFALLDESLATKQKAG